MTDKSVFITGATGDLGKALVSIYLENKYTVYASARDKIKLNELIESFNSSSLIPIELDLENRDTNKWDEILASINTLDVLINNAAYFIKRDFKSLTIQELEKAYQINVFAPILLIQKLLKPLSKSNNAQVINISSAGGINNTVKYKDLLPYSSSKGALSIASECLAVDLKEENIRVNNLALGAVDTKMLKKAFPLASGVNVNNTAMYIYMFSISGKVINGASHLVTLNNP